MKKMIIPILLVGLSFAQFEAGKKMVGGKVADFDMDMFTWTVGSGDDAGEVALTDMTVELDAAGSYFVIDNFAVSFGLKYTMNNATWTCDGEECEEMLFWTAEDYMNYMMGGTGGGTGPEVLSPFGFMIGGQYHMGNTYGFGSFNDPSSEDDTDAFLAFGGGYMHELASGVYLDVRAEYRHSLAGDNTAPTPEGLIPAGSMMDVLLMTSATESTALGLVGSAGITVVF